MTVWTGLDMGSPNASYVYPMNQPSSYRFSDQPGYFPPREEPVHIIPVLQNTAVNVSVLMRDANTGLGKAGFTLTIKIEKNGGADATITPTVTDRGDGRYTLALTSAHTDTLGKAPLKITAVGAIDNHETVLDVVPAPGGTLKANCVVDNYTFNAQGSPLTWRERVFASSAAATTAYTAVNTTTGQGNADGADGEVEREKYTAEYDTATGKKLLALKRLKEL